MNASELANKMLQWEQLQREADELEAEIEEAVLALGKTQTVGSVRASYSKGRKRHDWQGACDREGVDLSMYEKVSYNYRQAAKDNELEVPYTQSEPSVTVKLLS